MFGPYHEWMFDGWVGMLLGGLWMILFLSIPFLLIVALLKYLFIKSRNQDVRETQSEQKTPLDILKEAYARGEIGRDEFLQKRGDLLEK